MSISIIAAIGKNNELGKNNDLIWHFKEDMKFFKETTMGGSVIMGRKTFESLPKALPGRQNVVISSNPDYKAEGAVVADGVKEAIALCEKENIFCIGGGSVYKAFLPFAEKLYLTEINAECPDADVYFPKFDKNVYSLEVIAEYNINGIEFSHILYIKR